MLNNMQNDLLRDAVPKISNYLGQTLKVSGNSVSPEVLSFKSFADFDISGFEIGTPTSLALNFETSSDGTGAAIKAKVDDISIKLGNFEAKAGFQSCPAGICLPKVECGLKMSGTGRLGSATIKADLDIQADGKTLKPAFPSGDFTNAISFTGLSLILAPNGGSVCTVVASAVVSAMTDALTVTVTSLLNAKLLQLLGNFLARQFVELPGNW